MRSIILNMMILSLAGSVIECDLLARDLQPTSFDIKNDVSDSFPTFKQEIQGKAILPVKNPSSIESEPLTEQITKQVTEQITEQTSKPSVPTASSSPATSTVPPPPPPPPVMTTAPTPPPPPPLFPGMQPVVTANQETDINELMENPKKELISSLQINEAKLFANTINLYLSGNKFEISQGIATGEKAMNSLLISLDTDLQALIDMNSNVQALQDSIDLFSKLKDQLNLLTTETYKKTTTPSKSFEMVKSKVEDIARSYFKIVSDSKDVLVGIPNIKPLKNLENILEKAIILSSSFYDLACLSEGTRNEDFTETSTKDVLSLINLKKVINNRLEQIKADDKITRNITLPTGVDIKEDVFLTTAKQYLEDTCQGTDQLKELFVLKDILDHKYTEIKDGSIDLGDTDPLTLIKTLKDQMEQLGNLLKLANQSTILSTYSQFGELFTGTNKKYGGALVRSVNSWISPYNSVPFEDSKIRSSFVKKTPVGNIIDTYFELLTVDGNLCQPFTVSAINIIGNRTKFKTSYFDTVIAKTTIAEEKTTQHMLQLTFDGKAVGTEIDSNKLTNSIAFSVLQKNCMEYVTNMSDMINDLQDIVKTIIKLKNLDPQVTKSKIDTYINNILDRYIVFEPKFNKKADQIFMDIEDKENGFISQEDIANVVFVLAQNCDMVVQSSLPLFPTSSPQEDTCWVLEMSNNLSNQIDKAINVIQKLSKSGKFEEIIRKLRNLREPIEEAIQKASIPPTN